MVHALKLIHNLLALDGRLVDIRPAAIQPSVNVRVGKKIQPAGYVQENDQFVEYRQADAALQEALQLGLYEIEKQAVFPFHLVAASLQELSDYFATDWKDAYLDAETIRRAGRLLSAGRDEGELVVREEIQIARLRPLK